MVSLHLAQLVHTSFPVVGFRTVVSRDVPPEIQQAFIEQVVYQHWDSYDPPSPGYRAAYLYQLTSEQSLFGWLYNDGLDDFGRSDVPYFVCYYLAGQLQPFQLENILICLCTGPIRLIDRQNLPTSLESLVMPDLWSYQPARTGVKIPQEIIEHSHISLQHGELLNLFVFAVEEKIQDTLIADRNLLSASISNQPNRVFYVDGNSNHTMIQTGKINSSTQELSASMPSAEDYQKILLTQTRLKANQKAVVSLPDKFAFVLGIIVSNIFVLTMISVSYYFVQFTPLTTTPEIPNSIPQPKPALDYKNLSLTKTLTGHADAVWSVVLANNGQTLVSASADKTIKVWNLDTGKVISTLQGHSDTVRTLTLSADGQTLVSGSGDKTIKIWNFQTFELMKTLTPDAGPVWSVAVSRDGQILVSGNEDGSIRIWNLYTDTLLHTIQGHQGRVFSVAISPDGETLATGGIDKTIKIWNLQTGQLLSAIAQHEDAVRSVIFSHDGKKIVSASWDQTIKIWNLQTGELLHTLIGHTSRVVSLSLGIDGQTLTSGSLDNKIKIWNLQTGKLLRTLSGHTDWILAISANPSQQILVSASKDKTIRIWQPQSHNK